MVPQTPRLAEAARLQSLAPAPVPVLVLVLVLALALALALVLALVLVLVQAAQILSLILAIGVAQITQEFTQALEFQPKLAVLRQHPKYRLFHKSDLALCLAMTPTPVCQAEMPLAQHWRILKLPLPSTPSTLRFIQMQDKHPM